MMWFQICDVFSIHCDVCHICCHKLLADFFHMQSMGISAVVVFASRLSFIHWSASSTGARLLSPKGWPSEWSERDKHRMTNIIFCWLSVLLQGWTRWHFRKADVSKKHLRRRQSVDDEAEWQKQFELVDEDAVDSASDELQLLADEEGNNKLVSHCFLEHCGVGVGTGINVQPILFLGLTGPGFQCYNEASGLQEEELGCLRTACPGAECHWHLGLVRSMWI